MHSTEDGEGHAEIKLSDDSAEPDDQVDGSPSFQPATPQQNWRNLCFCVLGMLLIFGIGRIIILTRNVACLNLQFNTVNNTCIDTHLTVVIGPPGYMIAYVSQNKHQGEPVGCEPQAKVVTGSQTQVTSAPVTAAAAAPEETELQWKDITQLLKQKLSSQSFTKTLRYFQQHQPVYQEVSTFLKTIICHSRHPVATYWTHVVLQSSSNVISTILDLKFQYYLYSCELEKLLSSELVTPRVSRDFIGTIALFLRACDSLVDRCGLTLTRLESLFVCSDFNLPRHAAGSEEDENLGSRIFNEFKLQRMDPWTDVHYVQLQMPNRFDVTLTSRRC